LVPKLGHGLVFFAVSDSADICLAIPRIFKYWEHASVKELDIVCENAGVIDG
jgi:hypothetical protein